MGLFRRDETRPDSHSTVLDLIEQVAQLRGQVRAMETEWDDMRSQIRKGYQRMERAHQRLEKAKEGDWDEAEPAVSGPVIEGHPGNKFLEKYAKLRASG